MLFYRISKRIAPKMCMHLTRPFLISQVFNQSFNFQTTPSVHSLKKRHFYGSRACQSIGVSATKSLSNSHVVVRISRSVRSEAEAVLFDYLHSTRGFQYSDAEFISKNCPNFIEYLVSKVKNDDEEVTRSLTRFIRYHPINEFEPFFESLNLTQSEIPALLERHLMYLSDDKLMLENFHTLCNYGIPRNRIGRMYKEEREIFGYDYGVLALKLSAYEGLGLSVSTVVKLVSCCPSFLIGGVNEDFVGVHGKLQALGVNSGWLVTHLSDGRIYNWSRMLEMICFLEKMGCSKKDMEKLFKTSPGFLIEDSGKKVYVLVSILLKVGLKMGDILVIFLHNPRVLAGKFAKNLWEAAQFLTEIGVETKDIVKFICAHTQILGNTPLRKPSTVMSKLGVGPERLCEIINEDPLNFIKLASRMKAKVLKEADDEKGEHLVEKTRFLQSIGYLENSEEMVKALKEFRGRGDQLQERFDCLVNAGLDCHVVSNMVKRVPEVLNQSKDVLEIKLEYLVNHMDFPINSLESFPSYLCYNIEKIKLRFSMCMWLRDKGVVKPKLTLSVLACSEARFIKYHVNAHPEGPAQWEKMIKTIS